MALQDILTYTPIYGRMPGHLGYAARLAARLHARLTGIYVHLPLNTFAVPDDPGLLAALATQRDKDMDEAKATGRRFTEFAHTFGVQDSDWLIAEGEPSKVLALAGACHDLLVVGVGEHSGSAGFEPIEHILLEARMPCLLVPDAAATSDRSFERIVIGWNGSIEAMRTVHAALPLLSGAKQVVLLKGRTRDYRVTMPQPPALDIDAYLARHRIAFEQQTLATEEESAGESLLAAADHLQADLLIMGAYGHSRFSEWLLGGATRHVLRHARIPVYMHH